MTDANFEFDWAGYYAAVALQPPRHTLVRTLTRMDIAARSRSSPPSSELPVRHAVDLGCGSGRDTLLLLERGWQVLAVDAEAQAIAALQARVSDRAACEADFGQRLTTCHCRFEHTPWPASLDLVNASFSLPFCAPDQFASLWQSIGQHLRSGGWFCGQFFGDRDAWASYANVTGISRDTLLTLLRGMTIVELEEEEHDGQTATGTAKHWHIFHVIARLDQPPRSTSSST